MMSFEFFALLPGSELGEPLSFSSLSGTINTRSRAAAMAEARYRALDFFAPDRRSLQALAGQRFYVTISHPDFLALPWRERFEIPAPAPSPAPRSFNSSSDLVERETDWRSEEMST